MSSKGVERTVAQRHMKALLQQCLAEIVGTFILVFFGVGVVHTAVLTGAQAGLWQVAVVWGIGIAVAIYATAATSGAHLNPAVTIALATFRNFPWRNVMPYILAQLIGATIAGAVLYAIFAGPITAFEVTKHITRGAPGSELTGMLYGEYFPNQAMLATTPALTAVTLQLAMLAEAVGTAFLVFVIFAVTDEHNESRPPSYLAPVFIGFTVSCMISILAPISQAGFNPARDFGPRIIAWLAGWGSIAIPGPHGEFFTVYILSPVIGALAGGLLYKLLQRQPAAVCTLAEACDE